MMREVLTGLVLLAVPNIAAAQDFTPPRVSTQTPGGVNLSDGSFMMSDDDLSIGPLKFTRFHLGGQRDPNSPPFGPRITHSFAIYVAPNQSTRCSEPGYSSSCVTSRRPIVHLGGSATGRYSDVISNSYNYSIVNYNDGDSTRGTLSRVGAKPYKYVDNAGSTYVFSMTLPAGGVANAQRIESISFADGRKQTFSYDDNSRLKLVSDSSGYAIAFDYNTSGLISVVCGYNTSMTFVTATSGCGGSTIKSTYTYYNKHLSEVVNAAGERKIYNWDGDRITCVSYDGQICRISNTYASSAGSWMVSKQTMADGKSWSFSYMGRYDGKRNPETYSEALATTSVQVTDPNNNISTYSFMESSPVSITDANGNTSKYVFDGGRSFDAPSDNPENFGSTLLEVTFPKGNKMVMQYQAPRRELSKTTLISSTGAKIEQTVGYDSACDLATKPQLCPKPIWIKDAKGNQTDFTYTSFGQLESELKPASSNGSARLLTIYSYIQRYPYIRNASGGLTQQGDPVWVKSSETICQAVAGGTTLGCDNSGIKLEKTFEYAADGSVNNLLPRGVLLSADGEFRRTCYAYDYSGNQTSETKPRAKLNKCQ